MFMKFINKVFPKLYRRIMFFKRYKICMGHDTLYTFKELICHIGEFPKWNVDAKKIRKEYTTIALYGLHWGRIGEAIAHYLLHLNNLNSPDQLKILVSQDYVRDNKAALRIMRRYIPVIMDDEYAYWLFICLRNIDMIGKGTSWVIQVDRDTFPVDAAIDSRVAKEFFLLTENEKRDAIEKFSKLDIKGDFICIHNRDAAYLNDADTHHKNRMFSIENFSLTAQKFKQLEIALVRVGQKAEKRVNFDNCIDFANDYYDELLDIYLTGHCKFWIGAESGAYLLPRVQNVPVATINVIMLCAQSFAYVPVNENNMYIIRKYYNEKEQRYYSLWEILMIDARVEMDSRVYDTLGVKLIPNTEEEIYDLAREMNDRLDGTWIETDEDRLLQEKYQKIIDYGFNLMGYNPNRMIKARIGTKFLRDNMYLLDYPSIVASNIEK